MLHITHTGFKRVSSEYSYIRSNHVKPDSQTFLKGNGRIGIIMVHQNIKTATLISTKALLTKERFSHLASTLLIKAIDFPGQNKSITSLDQQEAAQTLDALNFKNVISKSTYCMQRISSNNELHGQQPKQPTNVISTILSKNIYKP